MGDNNSGINCSVIGIGTGISYSEREGVIMEKYYEKDGITIYNGDALEVMEHLTTKGIKFDAIITDPPYGTIKGGAEGMQGKSWQENGME
jgi:tRNA G10  N-methylase Trm11